MITTIIAISLWIATVVGWVIFNLYTKNKKLETMVVNQQLFIDGIKGCMKEVNTCANHRNNCTSAPLVGVNAASKT